MKIAIYARVSTTKQELENQLIELRNFAKKKEWKIYREYTDIVTGKEVSELNRPAFKQMFKDAWLRNFDLILFWALDRFSRAGTLYTLKKLQELSKWGVKWQSYTEPYFNSLGEFKDIILSVMATLAKLERIKISERTKAGIQRKKLEAEKKGIKLKTRGKDKKSRTRKYWKKPKD